MMRDVPGLKAADLGGALIKQVQMRGLGAMSKREVDALLLHLIEAHSQIGSLSNHEAGLLLRAPATRIKALRQEAMYRFVEDLPELATKQLLEALKSSKYRKADDFITLVIENSVGREALLAELKVSKSVGISNPGNSEVIEAPRDAVIDILERLLPEDERREFLKAVNRGRAGILKRTFKEAMRKVLDEVKTRSAGEVVDMAKDQLGKHIGDLPKLAHALSTISNLFS